MIKKYLTSEQAISLLPEGDYVHTFYGGVALIGADWERQEVIDKLKSVDKIEIAGEMARNMGHGLAVYNDDVQYMSDILFVETDKKKLDAFDPLEEPKKDPLKEILVYCEALKLTAMGKDKVLDYLSKFIKAKMEE